MLTQGPQFEKSALASFGVDAATTKAPLVPDCCRQASSLLLPAVTATNTPEFQRLLIAVVNAVEGVRSRGIFATAGLRGFAGTPAIPSATSGILGVKPQTVNTRPPGRRAPL